MHEKIKVLTPLEERFLSPRILFMKIQTLSHAGQFSILGKVVNVPTDVEKTVSILLRLAHETNVLPVALKKKKNVRSNYLYSSVRPNFILDAVRVVKGSEVYESAKISINESRFIQSFNETQNISGIPSNNESSHLHCAELVELSSDNNKSNSNNEHIL